MNSVVTTTAEHGLSGDQLKLVTDVVAKGATPDELKLFLYRCKAMGLDPLKPGQIHFTKYGSGPGTIVVGIDGFRTRAARSGKLSGIKRGPIRDDKGKCIGAWAEVYRSDWQHCARIEVSLAEYSTGRGPWQKMPETMIQKVAEAQALRMAFPDDLGGLYAQEEMDQAAASKSILQHPGDEDGSGITDGIYRIDFGQWNKRTLAEVYRDPVKGGREKIANYIEYLQNKAAEDGKEIDPSGKVGVFIAEARAFLEAIEVEGEPA
jgi:phage recombination protein Bet